MRVALLDSMEERQVIGHVVGLATVLSQPEISHINYQDPPPPQDEPWVVVHRLHVQGLIRLLYTTGLNAYESVKVLEETYIQIPEITQGTPDTFQWASPKTLSTSSLLCHVFLDAKCKLKRVEEKL